MNAKILDVSQRSLHYEILEEKKLTYIMQGRTDNRALDIYHLILVPTHVCNLRCKHCYMPDHNKSLLPKDVVLRLIDEWNEIVLEERGFYGGIFHIKGGEPFITPYLSDIINKLVAMRSLRFMITTNGTFLNEDIFKQLYACSNALDGRVTVIVSLDGNTEEINALLRGNGQFVKTLAFIKWLREHEINFHLNCVLHLGNVHKLSEYIIFAREHGATQVNFLYFVPRGIGSDFRDFQIPHLEAYRRLDTIYKNLDEETKELLAGSFPYIKYKETQGYYRTSHECVAAYRGLFYITPNGNVYTCPNIVFPEFSMGNVFQQNLREISNGLSTLYERLKMHNAPYICTGEKVLYKRNCDQYNQKSLDRLQRELIIPEETLDISMNGTSKSYCFSRNW